MALVEKTHLALLQILSACLCIGLLASCKPERSRLDNRETSPVTSTPLVATSHVGSLAGDTLELVSIGGRALPASTSVHLPCDSAGTPLLERKIFTGDSTYTGIIVLRPGCRDERMSSSDTLEFGSLYVIHGDTLTLYVGDGDEIFQSFNGRLFLDSVVQVAIENERARKYSRRRAASQDTR